MGCAAMCGACMAFLSRNAYPAQMFMGDTGSMFIGGAVVAAAMLLRQPLILVLIAFWMLMSSLSGYHQITYFKKTHKASVSSKWRRFITILSFAAFTRRRS